MLYNLRKIFKPNNEHIYFLNKREHERILKKNNKRKHEHNHLWTMNTNGEQVNFFSELSSQ